MAERNIAALLDNRAYTIHVQYQHSEDRGTRYTYITNIPGIVEGMFVLVPTRVRDTMSNMQAKLDGLDSKSLITNILGKSMRLSVARVVQVDDQVEIPPNDDIEYAWVIQLVDFTSYETTMVRNAQINAAVSEAYTRNLRKSFAERILGDLPETDRLRLENLLQPKE